jgi:hypothetical protein
MGALGLVVGDLATDFPVIELLRKVSLARVPTRWNHLVEKNSRKFNGLSMIFSQKWFPLLRIML